MTKQADKPDAPPPRKAGPARVLGSLVGATTALPAATGVFVSAGLAGVPVGTAISRSVIAGALVWSIVGLAVRILFSVVIRDWKDAAGRVIRRNSEE